MNMKVYKSNPSGCIKNNSEIVFGIYEIEDLKVLLYEKKFNSSTLNLDCVTYPCITKHSPYIEMRIFKDNNYVQIDVYYSKSISKYISYLHNMY